MAYLSVLGFVLAAWIAFQWALFRISERKVRHIPTVGSDGFISSYISAWKFMLNGRKIVQEGYEKHKGSVFKVPTIMTANRWLIVGAGADVADEFKRASEEELSFYDATFELFQRDFILGDLGPPVRKNRYHIDVIRGPLTRGLPLRFEDLKDEIETSVGVFIPLTEDWTPIQVYKELLHVVSRTTNRIFVGLPLCRNTEYCKIQEDLTVNIFTVARLLNLLPLFMRPLGGRLFSKFQSFRAAVAKHIEGIWNERRELEEEYGKDWEGKPNDAISWLMDAAPDDPEYQSSSDLTMRIISLNMAAIHTTSLTLNHCLFDLAARQEYLEPLRMEVEEIIGAHGWTKESMARMHKLDSFIKESSRTSGLTTLSMQRQTRVDFRLSNGVVIPKGFRVAVASAPLHNDPEIYPEPTTFKGFRFVEGSERDQLKGEGAVEDGLSRQTMVALSPSFLHFGAGRHACPGRFFAVNEVKAILAYILMTYDMKLPGKSTTPPAARWIADARVPDPNTEIFFRKRV